MWVFTLLFYIKGVSQGLPIRHSDRSLCSIPPFRQGFSGLFWHSAKKFMFSYRTPPKISVSFCLFRKAYSAIPLSRETSPPWHKEVVCNKVLLKRPKKESRGLQRSNPKKVANCKFQKSRTFKIEDVHSRFPYSKSSVPSPKITNSQQFRWHSIDKRVG